MILVDAMQLVYRCAWKLQDLQTRDGRRTGMELGFLKSLEALKKYFNDDIILCWEGRNNFRLEIDPKYKANRRNRHSSMLKKTFVTSERLSEFRRILKHIAHNASAEHLEADDIIATLTERFAKTEPILIYSNDKDLHQLLSDSPFPVVQVTHMRFREDPLTVRKLALKFNGLTPQQFPIYQAIVGDKIDNIPGVSRIRSTIVLDALQAGYTPENIFSYPLFSLTESSKLEMHITSGRYAKNIILTKLKIDPNIVIDFKDEQSDTVGEWLSDLEIRSLKLCHECGIEPALHDEDEF